MTSRDKSPKPAFDPIDFLGKPSRGVTLERLQKHQKIYAQGDPADTIGYIRKGSVKRTILSGHGKEAIVGILRQGQFFGEICLGGTNVRTATIVAVEECLITWIAKETMLSTLSSESNFSTYFVAHLLARNVRLEEDLIDQLINSSERRLARLLLLLAKSENNDSQKSITVSLSQETLAEMIGTTRSRVSTFMNRFREKGYIEYDGHNGTIQVYVSLLLTVLGG
jgi:CRP-like cAMP-binding protein